MKGLKVGDRVQLVAMADPNWGTGAGTPGMCGEIVQVDPKDESHPYQIKYDIKNEPGWATESAVALETPSQAEAHTPEWRKQRPLYSGVLAYFPDALLEVAYCSWVGNQQHHPDKPLHWDKSRSTDEPDALMRHLGQRGTLDSDRVRHSAKVAWRALALLQRELDAEKEAS